MAMESNIINTDLKSFRRILNQAVDENLFPYEKNPFLRYKHGSVPVLKI